MGFEDETDCGYAPFSDLKDVDIKSMGELGNHYGG
jgi:hypothetical protein